ncbi:uncharacterized protein GGS22DRAFT_168696 [Annulohypoxylon maeteangense]|uniref:uncharacterized protein n=1 Tax=Annulohypoxylon maeteangense TaxID=1927788 RepID=UPI0020076BA5|nr:uncharacterized protein GGS22DRAFT_168696 [Annulohypoxylon maeteangense]KAI0882775.1 hypothetical protein GGS22DRAFT_168696 [Annulohypoxylon maeteangense]
MKGSCAPLVLLLLAVLGLLAGKDGLADGRGIASRDGDGEFPGLDGFFRHRYPTVVAFGNRLYIDGGELSQQINGTGSNGTQSYSSYAANATFSLNLTESWTNETVSFRSISKTAPLLDQQIYWTDPTNGAGALYTWGGMAVGSDPPPENQLWLLNTDSTGGGTWSEVTQVNFRDFAKLSQPVGAAFTQTSNAGFALGGQVTSRTDSGVQKEDPGYALTGLVSYNFRTGLWSNSSTVSNYGGYGTNLNGLAEFVPFGPNGLLLFLGGAETPVDATNFSISQVDWNHITLYDPVTGMWYRQETSGSRPPTVERACSVGVKGPNNTYEIFIYGGTTAQGADGTDSTSADVHVLSLPGFVFFDAHSPGTPRADHACTVVGGGKRQMLSYGGVDGGPGLRNPTTTADPWKQGLGIYDMTEMKWTDSYDPNAAKYESPARVTDWYTQGGMNTVTWCKNLRELFVNGSSGTYGTNSTTGNSTSTDPDSSRFKRTGIIVGSTVGGVVFLSIMSTVIFLVLRWRRRRRESTIVASTLNEYRPEPWPKDTPRMRSVTPGTMVSSPTPVPIEISGTVRGELPAEDVDWTYELPVPTPKLRPELPDRKYSY